MVIGDGVFRAPRDLFDPLAPHLDSLLPEESFPDKKLYVDRNLLHSLLLLGLGTTLTCTRRVSLVSHLMSDSFSIGVGVLRAAISLHAAASNSSSRTIHDSSLQQRALGLLRHIDVHGEDLSVALDRETSDTAFRDLLIEASRNSAAIKTDFNIELEDSADSSLIRQTFLAILRRIRWVPALAQPAPSSIPISAIPGGHHSSYAAAHAVPPWPESIHKICALAAPIDCRPPNDLWMCSATLR